VHLTVGHGTRFEPAVEDFVDALQHTLALLARDLDVIDEFAVDVGDLASAPGGAFRSSVHRHRCGGIGSGASVW